MHVKLAKIPSELHSNLIILSESPDENCERITERYNTQQYHTELDKI